MASSGPRQRFRENLSGIVATIHTGVWLAAMLTGQSWWLAYMLFGYIVIVPLVGMVFEDPGAMEDDSATGEATVPEGRRPGAPTEDDDALATLRERYARGELTDEQFNRKVDRLLETETIEDIEERDRARQSATPEREEETDSR